MLHLALFLFMVQEAPVQLKKSPPISLSDSERFTLFNVCRPMKLVISGLGDSDPAIELTEERIRVLAESRLRSARLYTENPEKYDGVLFIDAKAVSEAFNLRVAYLKTLFDPATLVEQRSETWIAGSYGSHFNDPEVVIQKLAAKMDLFLVEYLRVNEAECTPTESTWKREVSPEEAQRIIDEIGIAEDQAIKGKVPVAAKRPVRLGSKNLFNPVPIHRPEPGYPKECLDPRNPCHRVEGKVFLQAVIRKNGRVEILKVIASRPKGPAGTVFVKEAVYHIYEKWKFKPGTLNGEPVDVVTGIEVLFNPR